MRAVTGTSATHIHLFTPGREKERKHTVTFRSASHVVKRVAGIGEFKSVR